MHQKIIDIFSEVSGYSEELINGETFIKNTGIDSISIIQIIVKVEQEFEIEIDDEDLDFSKIVIVNDIINIVKRKL